MFQSKAELRRLLATLLLSCLLSGCSQWYWDLGTHLADYELPQPGQELTLQQALDLLGPPQRMSAEAEGYVLAWEHWHIKEVSLGLSLGAMGADFLSADWGEMRAKGEFVLLAFDHQHTLTEISYSEWDNYGGGGKAIQPFAGFVSVVDAGDLVYPMPQHRWGASALLPVNRGLNRQSDPNNGQNGVEQRGTPASAGQRSLE